MDEKQNSPRAKRIGLFAAALIVAFLIGFVPQWVRVGNLQETLEETTYERSLLDLGGRLGAALAEAQRGNYERARQLMAGFFSQLQTQSAQITEPGVQTEIQALLEQRDEVITLLSRAEPESVSRLNMMYTRYFAAVHPAGDGVRSAVTPPPPP